MKMGVMLAFVVMLILCVGLTSAENVQPTQQYNKIYLSPFYRASMTQNTNYTYAVMVNPPDRVSEVKSAIISLDAWINPTRTFMAWVNGIACRSETYTVSTTYAGAGRAVPTFDCGNVITAAGNYTVTLQVTGGNIGASTAWLEIVYMNDPVGNLEMAGTEYRVGDEATIFLQLKDNQGNPVQNGTCYLDIYAPLLNGSHPHTLNDAPMLNINTTDGLYYYDLVVPNTTGVHMLAARCAYTTNNVWVYDPAGVVAPVGTVVYGTYEGTTLSLINKDDGIYEHSTSQPVNGIAYSVAQYDYNFSSFTGLNITHINLYWLGESNYKPNVDFSAYNWTSDAWVALPNSLTLKATALTGQPSGIDELISNSIPVSLINTTTKILRIKLNASRTSSFQLWTNFLNMQVITANGTVQDLKGSGEMHVNNWFDSIENDFTNLTMVTAQSVWNYTTRNLTFYADQTNYSQIQSMVWNATNRNLTFYPAQSDLTNYTLIAQNVWNYTGIILQNVVGQISTNIWNYTARYTHGELI